MNKFPYTVYPGETFQVSVAAVGQRNGTVPSTVISIINQTVNPGEWRGMLLVWGDLWAIYERGRVWC